MRIRNWDKWQSYRKDRGQPPWIKIHREVMRNPDWVALSDSQRGQLTAIWILAADRNGDIPDCPVMIKKLCYMDKEPDLQLFVTKGFLDGDANVTPERRQRDAPEAEKKQRREEKNKARPKDAFEVEAYAKSIEYNINGQDFIDHYETNGWVRGKAQTPVKDWKACVRTWKNRNGVSQEATPYERKL